MHQTEHKKLFKVILKDFNIYNLFPVVTITFAVDRPVRITGRM